MNAENLICRINTVNYKKTIFGKTSIIGVKLDKNGFPLYKTDVNTIKNTTHIDYKISLICCQKILDDTNSLFRIMSL
jgi:hypothetical protein